MGFRKVLERWSWDFLYRIGYWNYIDRVPEREVITAINDHLKGGRILDLGCGTGNVVAVLGDYSYYQGVDLSRYAIRKARERYESGKNVFSVADLREFEPQEPCNVILLSEVIYFVEISQVTAVLNRYKRHLRDDGVFIVRIYDMERKQAFIQVISEHFRILDRKIVQSVQSSIVLTFH